MTELDREFLDEDPPTAELLAPTPPVRPSGKSARLRGRRLEPVAEEQIAVLLGVAGEHPDRELVAEILRVGVELVRSDASRLDIKILSASLREMHEAFRVFGEHVDRRKVSIFGSARTDPGGPDYVAAAEFSKRMVGRGYMVITGAGRGIMQAGHEGAGRENSFGVNIKLSFEQAANPVIDGDEKLLHFRYFFTRKLCFLKEASAVAGFPGGLGTHDEVFEALTLIQTGKTSLVPVVLIEPGGSTYWTTWLDYVRTHLLEEGMISEQDLNLFKITGDIDAAVEEICRFYGRYHSSRYVRDELLIRLAESLPPGRLELLNERFASLLMPGRGVIRETGPLMPAEADVPDLAGLPRLLLPFNRRDFGTLRALLDEVNR